MTEELQQLLDRIRSEGVDKAQNEANVILENARKEATELVAQAKTESEAFRSEAQRDADAFAKRAEESLRQAARDVLIQVEQDLVKRFERVLLDDVEKTVADETTLTAWIADAVAAYLKGGAKEIEVVLGGGIAAQAAGLVERLRGDAATAKGVVITPSPAFPNGFTLRLEGGRIEHSFTAEAITAALSRLLRPQLAKLIQPTE